MNCCRETTKTGVPPDNRAQRRRLRRVQGVGSEAYLNGTSQGPTSEDGRKGNHIIRARSAPLSHAPQAASATSGFPVSWSQQVIHEISGLGLFRRHYHPFAKKPVISRSGVRDQCTNAGNLTETTVGKQHFQFFGSKEASEIGNIPDEPISLA